MEEYEYTITGEPIWGDGLISYLFSFENETNSIIDDELYMARIVTSCVMEVDESLSALISYINSLNSFTVSK